MTEGYQKTEIGLIPKVWEVRRIGELGEVVRGGSPRPAGDPRFFDGSFIPWLTVASLTNISPSQMFVTSTETQLTEAGSKRSRILDPDTLIISNSGATLGVAKILKIQCCANDGVAALVNQNSGNSEFLAQYFNTQTKRLHDVVASGNGQPNLNTDLIREIVVPFPPILEQEVIAEALSDVDALIESLEELIAKKRAIKTATMQQLLTGKTRLPGFGEGVGTKQTELGEIPEDWEVRTYGNTFEFLSTCSNPRADLNERGDVGYIHYGDIHTSYHDVVDANLTSLPQISASKVGSAARLRSGDLVVADASEDYDGIGKSVEIKFSSEGTDIVAGLHTFLLRDSGQRYADGIRGYLHKVAAVKKQMDRLATGLKVYGLSKDSLQQIAIPCPPKPEQKLIAKVLEDMQEDIAIAEAHLAKTKALKQGMMQELLTGRTRLV